ncbi:FkbM family methyltransferase [Mycobacterium vicinigordonae]|uniref:FkbM family methyltransferase n=1 Tax=Mycobacterium vicinigordonae TaxID=1719132 RepID=A0A7D6E6Z3_9MYCO|nr:FkbM family methyltransferase [Mycobacterium vicinigordonae]QLL06565.1 FkbM family methyltransferase [Mycobacterium vicinigordonae]
MTTRVLVVGPAPAQAASRGGMATVIKLMTAHPNPRISITMVPTYIEGSFWYRRWVGLSGMVRATWLVLRGRADILHVHLAHGGSVLRKAVPMAAARLAKVPTVVHAHSYDFGGWFDGLPAAVQPMVRRALAADRWLVLGSRHLQEYAGRLGLAEHQIGVLNNAVPIPSQAIVQSDVDRLHAVSLGRLGVRKGSYDLIDAVGKLDPSLRGRLSLTLAGDGDVEEVRAAVQAAGLSETIHVAGWLDPAARDLLLCSAHIFVLPSYDEGLPMALLEAMAYGLAPVATPVGSIGDAITDRVNGLLVEPGRPGEIAAALTELLKDDTLRAELARAARGRASDFGLQRWYDRLDQEWADVRCLRTSQRGGATVSVKELLVQSDAANWAAKYVTVRNVGRVFGRTAMTMATEALWRRRLRQDRAMSVADHFATRGATVLDVGASWGLFSYHLARRVGKTGQLCSFEPHPDNAPMLRKLDQALPHVHFQQAAVSDEAGAAQLLVPRQRNRQVTAQGSLAHGFDGQGVDVLKIDVPLVRLDDVLAPDARVDFVKIDVEGHEMSVLHGGSETLRRCRPAILIEIEQRHLSAPIAEVFAFIEALGYHLFYVTESGLRPIAEFDVHRDQLAMVNSGEFHPFAMPKGYVHDFCAVRSPELVDGFRS